MTVSTKVGYGVEGEADWTGGCVRRGIDEALRRLRTDFIDVVLLHSCGIGLERDEAILAGSPGTRWRCASPPGRPASTARWSGPPASTTCDATSNWWRAGLCRP